MAAGAEEPYDVNFCLPIREIENDRVKLTPFIPSEHGQAFWEGTRDHPEVYTYLPFGPFLALDAFVAYIEQRFHSDPAHVIFAVLDKSASLERPPLAALTGFLNANPENLAVEVGMLICLPSFLRKRITYSAVALLLQYALELPSVGGLGLRRVQYQAHASNERSLGLAQKIGFQLESVQRWQRVLAGDKLGNGQRERKGDSMPNTKGRDTAVLSVCWDDWEREVRTKVCLPEYKRYTN